jgi:putative redox protein
MDLITVRRKDGFAFDIRVRGHQLTCDLSEKDGGQDRGPSPAELLAASLGACTAMMIQGYCQGHGHEGDVGVSLTIELANDPKRVGSIVIDVELPAAVPKDKLDVIRRVAEHCPVHQTLNNPPQMDIDIT